MITKDYIKRFIRIANVSCSPNGCPINSLHSTSDEIYVSFFPVMHYVDVMAIIMTCFAQILAELGAEQGGKYLWHNIDMSSSKFELIRKGRRNIEIRRGA